MPSTAVASPRPPVEGRLFLGVALIDTVRAALVGHLAAALGRAALPGRRVAPENWHLTLRFLGDIDPRAGRRLTLALRAAAFGAPFSVGFAALGAFPRATRAQALWLGVDRGVAELRSLAAAVEQAVVAAGFPADSRPFAAHLTLSRLRPPEDVARVVAAVPSFAATMPVDRVTLYRSDLARDGPRYTVLEAFHLLSD